MSFFDIQGQRRTERDFTFLEGLTPREWAKLFSFAEVRGFKRGDALVSIGDEDHSFYILTAGSAEVVNGKKVLGLIPQGSVFGEVAFFDGLPRTATIRAFEDGSTVRISRAAFDNLAAWEPVLARRVLCDLGKALALRFRAAQERARN